jgi:hypothetical protein
MWVRYPGSLVVAGDDEDRDPPVRDLSEGLERLVHQARRHLRPVEHVPTVHHHVHGTTESRRQRPPVVGQEIVAPASPTHPGSKGQVEPEVRVGQQEDS